MKATITAMILVPLLSALTWYGVRCVNSRVYDRWYAWGILVLALLTGIVSIGSYVWSTEERLQELEDKVRALQDKDHNTKRMP